ncbi:MAG: hypothetical protein KDE03_11425 [Rhodobacteraceae bacterium]|nr:hypothetical protein [Paracoccaceae bacterium]
MSTEANQPDDGTAKLANAIEGLVSKHGSEIGAIQTLLDENLKYRDKLRDLKRDLEAAKAGAVPDGAVVLSGDDLKAYEALKALGDAKSIGEAIEAGKAAQTELGAYRRADKRAKAARVAKANPDILATLDRDGIEYDVEGDGDDAKAIIVTKDGETDVRTPFWEFVGATWPALRTALAQDGTPAAPAPRFPAQPVLSPRTPAGPASVVDIIKRKRQKGEGISL